MTKRAEGECRTAIAQHAQWSWGSSPRAMLPLLAAASVQRHAVAEAEETDPPTPPLDWHAAIASCIASSSP